MRSVVAIVCVIFVCAAVAEEKKISVSTSNLNHTYAPGDIIFQDEFDYLNLGVWRHEVNMNGGYNNEFQIYDRYSDNTYVRNGVLYIQPTFSIDTVFNGNYENLYNGHVRLEGCTDPPGLSCERWAGYPYIHPPVVSARLRTLGTFSFTYGRVEARARLPAGDWMWPAIWAMPEESRYGQWPRSGEIDIMESRGNRKLFDYQGINIGSEQTASTLHFGPDEGNNGWWASHGTKNTPVDQGYDRDFHVYQLEWTPEYLKFSVDNQEIRTVRPGNGGFWELGQFPSHIANPWTNANNYRMAPFDQNFHLILNVATGGGYFPDNTSPNKPWGYDTAFLDFLLAQDQFIGSWRQGEYSAMAVDYIRIYAI